MSRALEMGRGHDRRRKEERRRTWQEQLDQAGVLNGWTMYWQTASMGRVHRKWDQTRANRVTWRGVDAAGVTTFVLSRDVRYRVEVSGPSAERVVQTWEAYLRQLSGEAQEAGESLSGAVSGQGY